MNLSDKEFNCLFKFIKEKPFKVAECDKNIGVVIVNHNLYNNLCNSLLCDTNTYDKLDSNPLDLVNNQIKETLNYLLSNKLISKKIFEKLLVSNPKLGKFRILFKLHKTKFGLRPIINCKSHPTASISLLIDLILQPFVKNSDSYYL